MTEETLETQVIEDITENTEETVEETLVDSLEEQQEETKQNLLTEEQLKERLARQERSLTRKFEKELNEKLSKYQQTENILQKGLEVSNIDEANERLTEFYKEQGINIPEPQAKQFTDWEINVLAKAEAEEIINDGFDEMEKEADRLAAIGYVNLNKKEKTIFNTIAERLVQENNKKDLAKNGIDVEILDNNDFKEFSKKFKTTENVVEVYNLYKKNVNEKKEIKPIGSMKSNDSNKTKDYYTPEEARKLTIEDYKKDPELENIIVKSAAIWQSKGL